MDKQQFIQQVLSGEQTLYRVARAMLRSEADQQDAVQEAILKAWAKRHTLRDEQHFSAWLVRILINECKSIYRRQSRVVLKETWDEVSLGSHTHGAQSELDALMDELPERLRLPIVLHYIEGFSVKDIASMLHSTQGAIKKRMFVARRTLKLQLEQELEQDHNKEAWLR